MLALGLGVVVALGLGVLHGGVAQHASRPQSALATLESSWLTLTLTLTLNPNPNPKP